MAQPNKSVNIKHIQMYYLTFLEAGSWNQSPWGYSQGVDHRHAFWMVWKENLFTCLSQLLEAACYHWLVAPRHWLLLHCHISSLTLLSSSPIPHDYIDPTNVIHDSLPISRPLTLSYLHNHFCFVRQYIHSLGLSDVDISGGHYSTHLTCPYDMM